MTEAGLPTGAASGGPRRSSSSTTAASPRSASSQRRLRGRLRVRPARRGALPEGGGARQPRELSAAGLRAARGARRPGAGRVRQRSGWRRSAPASRSRDGRGRDGHAGPCAKSRLGQLAVAERLRESLGDPAFSLRSATTPTSPRSASSRAERCAASATGSCCYGNVGIGGAVIVDGALFRGSDGFAGEIGHIPVRPFDGELCRCGGRGCLETLAGQEAIATRARNPGRAQRDQITGGARRRAGAHQRSAGDQRPGRGRRVPRHLHRRRGLADQPSARRARGRARDARTVAAPGHSGCGGPAHDRRSDAGRDRRIASSATSQLSEGAPRSSYTTC